MHAEASDRHRSALRAPGHARAHIAWIVPPTVLVIGWAWCLAMRPEPASLLAPPLGPWAGIAYGHHDCTMAAMLPGWTRAVVALGVVALAACIFGRRTRMRGVLPFLVTLWTAAWVALAWLSVVNTLS